MYFALGVLTTGLLALLVMPAIWQRTARLTRKRIESSVPMTMAEIQADRDQLRAEFAITARKLEMTVDRLRDKTTEQVIEINEKRAEIVRLTNDVNDKAKTIEGLEERAARLVADLAAADERLSTASERISQREATIVERDSEIANLQAQLNAAQQLSDEQKLELVARDTEIGNLNDRLADAKATEQRLVFERDKLAEDLTNEQNALAAERRRVANLEASIARLEAERIDRLGEIERRAAEVHELTAELAKNRAHAEDLAARIAKLETEREARSGEFERRIAELEAERAAGHPVSDGAPAGETIFADGDNVAKAIAAAEAENSALTERLAVIEAEQVSLRAENEKLRRVASADWDIETENTLLREQLAGVAADVLQLSKSFKETGSGASRTENASANGGNGSANGGEASHGPEVPPHNGSSDESATPATAARPTQRVEGKSLAERLRALQHTAARH
jgi:DNA repair exonuclease SbcCD ATPase subunit